MSGLLIILNLTLSTRTLSKFLSRRNRSIELLKTKSLEAQFVISCQIFNKTLRPKTLEKALSLKG